MRFPTLLSCGVVFFLAVIRSQAVTITDSNANGMSDYWEKHWNGGALFPTGFSATADPDGDGWSNLTESVAGTNPKDANPPAGLVRLKILRSPAAEASPGTAGGAFVVTWPTIAGKQYKLFVSPDLSAGGWVLFDQPMMGTGAEIQIAIEPLNGDGSVPDRLFWRVAVDDVDSNGDGVSEYEAAAAAGGGGPGSIGGPGTIGGGPGSGGNGTGPNGGGGSGSGGGATADHVQNFEAGQFVLIPLDTPAATGLSDYRVDTITDDGRVLFELHHFPTGDLNDYWDSSTSLWQAGALDSTRFDSSFYSVFRMFGPMNRGGYYFYQQNSDDPAAGRRAFMGHLNTPVFSELNIPKFEAELNSQVLAYYQATHGANWRSFSLGPVTPVVTSNVAFHLLEDGSSFGEVWQGCDFKGTAIRHDGSSVDIAVLGWDSVALKWIQTGANGSAPQFFEGAGTLLQRSYLSQEFVDLTGFGGMGENGFCVIRKTDYSGPQVTGKFTNSLRNRNGTIIKQFDKEESDQILPPTTSRNGHVAQSGSSGVNRYHAISGKMEVLPPSIQGYVAGVNDQGDVLVSSAAAPLAESPNRLVRSFLDDASGETTWAQCVFSDDKLPDGWSGLNVQALGNSLPLARQRVLESEGTYPPAPEKAPVPLVAGTATKEGKEYPVLMVPVEMVPDYNRDGKITADDRGKITPNNPFRWWVNDDEDQGEIANDDTPRGDGAANTDANSIYVDGLCDLPDFFPIYLNLKKLLEVLPPGENSYRIVHEDSAFSYLETDLKTETVRDYLIDPQTADRLKSAQPRVMDATGSYPLSTSFLETIKNEEGKGILLIEGRRRTDKPIRIEVWKNQEKVGEVSFNIKTKGIEDMYRWINLRGISDLDPAENGKALGEVQKSTEVGEPSNRPDSLTSDAHFIFVHGYNVDEYSARGWGAEVFKRLYQLGMKAKFTMVTWHGNKSQVGPVSPDYWENVTNAFITSPHLASWIGGLSGTKTIAAHSLGNMVVSSAIKDHGLQVAHYFMLDAAVPLEAYDVSSEDRHDMRHPDWAQFNAPELLPYWASYWYQRFPATDGRNRLTWKGRFGDLPNAINYYSSGEEVLQNGNGGFPVAGSTMAWVSQEMSKGREDSLMGTIIFEDLQGGWGYNAYWKITEDNYTTLRVRTPQELAQIPLDQTKEKPFFRPFQISSLMSTNQGSATANQYWPRAKTLAEGIPALSFPAGSNPIEKFDDRNIDLMTLQSGWPEGAENMPDGSTNADGTFRKRWLHSDSINVAFRFNYKLYQSWLEK